MSKKIIEKFLLFFSKPGERTAALRGHRSALQTVEKLVSGCAEGRDITSRPSAVRYSYRKKVKSVHTNMGMK